MKDPKEQENLLTALGLFAVVAALLAVWTANLPLAGRALLTSLVFVVLIIALVIAGRVRQ